MVIVQRILAKPPNNPFTIKVLNTDSKSCSNILFKLVPRDYIKKEAGLSRPLAALFDGQLVPILLKKPFANSLHFKQLINRSKTAMLLTIADDCLRLDSPYTR